VVHGDEDEAWRLPLELTQHRVGELVWVELAGMGKLNNSNRHKVSDGNRLGSGLWRFRAGPAPWAAIFELIAGRTEIYDAAPPESPHKLTSSCSIVMIPKNFLALRTLVQLIPYFFALAFRPATGAGLAPTSCAKNATALSNGFALASGVNSVGTCGAGIRVARTVSRKGSLANSGPLMSIDRMMRVSWRACS
jgi:hypothetical protein